MSLINQMLKDLESRTRDTAKPDVALSGLAMTPDAQNYRKTITVFLAIIVFCASMVFFVIHHHDFLFKTVKNTAPVIVVNQPADIENLTNLAMPEMMAAPAILTGITLQTQQETTYLRFLISQSVLYRVSTDLNNRQVIIELEHSKLTTSLPSINYANTAVQNIEVQNEVNGDLKIVLTLTEHADLQHLELNQAGKLPELQLDILKNNASELPPATESVAAQEKPLATEHKFASVKKIVCDTSEQEQYEKALSYSAIGQNYNAIILLTNLVKQYPLFTPARQSLVGLLLQRGDRVQADQVLQDGLRRQSDFVPFVQLKARMLVDQKKIKEALELLEQTSPPITANPDYYAFIAALYQQQGNGELAANLYEQLLRQQPTKAVWWMGLGIALDTAGKHDEAAEAFSRAASNNGLSPELKAYVESRMHV